MNNRIKRNITIPDYILEIIKLFKDKNQEIYYRTALYFRA